VNRPVARPVPPPPPAVTTTLDPTTSEPAARRVVTDTAVARRRPPWPALLAAVVVAAVLGLYLRAALVTPVHFDGAMNLQVATNLARGMGWERFYHVEREFPSEVQTSGPFVVLDAAAIKVFGQTQFAYQFANLVFLTGLFAVLATCLRRARWAMVLAPALIVLGVPGSSTLPLGGLGEFAVSALTITAMAFVVWAITSSNHPYRELAIAAALVGTAVTVKTVALSALPIVVVAALLAILVRGLRWWKVGLSLAAAGIPLALFELYRLVSLGSVGAYRAYWSYQRTRIGFQSGLDKQQDDGGLVHKGLDHLDALTVNYEVSRAIVAMFLVVPLLVVAALVIANRRRLGEWFRQPLHVLASLLAVHVALYEVWWMFITPTQKAWLRRLVIGLVSLNLLYAVLIVVLVAGAFAARSDRRLLLARASSAVVLAVLAATVTLPVAVREAREMRDRPSTRLDSIEEAAVAVRDLAKDHRIFGDHWYSAPVMSLESDIGFYDVSQMGFCDFDPARDVLVFDHDAQAALDHQPRTRDGRLVFEEIADYPGAATLYSIAPGPDVVCPP
jgi:hypothetical protein